MNNIPLYLDDDQINDYSGSFKKGWKKLIKVLLYRERRPDVAKLNWLNQNRIEQAIDCFKKCVVAFPRSWSSMWGLGKAYQVSGEHGTALEWFEKTYLHKPDLVDVSLEASIEAMRIGSPLKALQYAQFTLALDRRNPVFHANLALAFLLNKKGDEALGEIQKALKLAPNNMQIQKAHIYLKSIILGNKMYPPFIDPSQVFKYEK